MNGNSVFGALYKVKGGKEVSLRDLATEPHIKKRVFDINTVMSTSQNYFNCRKFISVDWEASFELHRFDADWKKKVLDMKKKELYSLKKKIGFNTKESFAEAVEMGEESDSYGKDYIITVEDDVEKIQALKKPTAKKPTAKKTTAKKTVAPPSLDELMEEEGQDD